MVGVRTPTPLDARLAVLRAARGPGVQDITSRVRELVVLASSSRGGSSMLSELLRESPGLLHLRGEITPFLRLAGLAFPDSGSDSDRLDAAHVRAMDPAARHVLDAELARDVGQPSTVVDDERYALDVAWRFAIQWPDLDVDPLAVAGTARRVLDRLRAERGWGPHELRDVPGYHAALVRALLDEGHPVDPGYYDLPTELVGEGGGGPPGERIVEEPPFVLTRPWRCAGEADVESTPLVVKSPSNAYRHEFLRALFPNARIRVIHLTRNPAASINGLVDGWRHRGFHAHRMPAPLEISGYAEQCPADRWWWKFDLPPGWREHVRSELVEVCAFQWRSCHQSILDVLGDDDVEHVRVRFEDLIRTPESRAATCARLGRWLGIDYAGAFRRAAQEGIGPVAATRAPRPRRWRTREEAIVRVLRGEVRSVAERLGYARPDDWI